MAFPVTRMRRLRRTEEIRNMLRETRLSSHDLIYPFFVIYGNDKQNPIPSMPGVFQLSVDNLLPQVEKAVKVGVRAILLFGIPEHKDAMASGAYDQNGIIQEAVTRIKEKFPNLVVITDVCLCEYMSHGHCGLVKDGVIENDPTLELLAKTALSHARAGADMVAPSDMMDGRVRAIRQALDGEGFCDTVIMSYSAKYASAYYGPFRDAAGSAPQFGDRKTHQMDPGAGVEQALMETELDIEEGADLVIVKPALVYLDIIRQVKDRFLCPVVSYNVSGEYAMLKAAAQNGWLEEKRAVMEMMTGLKRAGSDLIITYYAREICRWLHEEE